MAAEIGFEQIFAAMKRMLPRVAAGQTMDEYKRELHVDPEGLRRASSETADEEFTRIAAMGPLSEGRLRRIGLSAAQRAEVREALIDTYEVAFVSALAAEQTRRAQDPTTESEAT